MYNVFHSLASFWEPLSYNSENNYLISMQEKEVFNNLNK